MDRPENAVRRGQAQPGSAIGVAVIVGSDSLNETDLASGLVTVRSSRGLVADRKRPQPSASVHRGRAQLALNALEVIEPLDFAVELEALLLGQLGFHAR